MLELSIFQSATGASSFDTLSLEQLRGAARRGNKSAANHSHLCAPQDADPWHVGAGVSLTAAALLAAIDKFRSPDMKQLIKQDLYNKVPQEFAWIKVHGQCSKKEVRVYKPCPDFSIKARMDVKPENLVGSKLYM